MSEQKQTASIGMVRQAAAEYYAKTGQKLPFKKAAEQAGAFPQASPPRSSPRGFLTLEDLWAYVESLPLLGLGKSRHAPPQDHAGYFGSFYLREENMFIADDDITVYIHVPFIFDGIHTHDHFEINYVYHGSCVLCFADRQETLDEGAFFILAPDSPHNVYTEDNSLVISVMVRKTTFHTVFSPLLKLDNQLSSFFREAIYLKDYLGCTMLGVYRSQAIQAYMQNLLIEYYQEDCYHNVAAISILTLVFSQILRDRPDYSFRFDFSDSQSGNLNFTVLIQYIRQNFGTVTLAGLSDLFHYSESYLSKLILRNTGKHFGEIVRELKMEQAKHLLLESGLTVEEIAYRVGYESANQFSRAFKQYERMTPLLFRKQVHS